MYNHIAPQDFTGKIFANAALLGPIAMVFFLVLCVGGDEWHMTRLSDLLGIFLIGSIICIIISVFTSLIVYRFLISMAIKKTGSAMEHFKRFLPVLVLLFPVGGTLLLLAADIFEFLFYNMLISAYLTAVVGWYWLSKSIAKRQQ